MAKKQSSSQVSLVEFITLSATLTNDAGQMGLQLFNTNCLLNLEGRGKFKGDIIMHDV